MISLAGKQHAPLFKSHDTSSNKHKGKTNKHTYKQTSAAHLSVDWPKQVQTFTKMVFPQTPGTSSEANLTEATGFLSQPLRPVPPESFRPWPRPVQEAAPDTGSDLKPTAPGSQKAPCGKLEIHLGPNRVSLTRSSSN